MTGGRVLRHAAPSHHTTSPIDEDLRPRQH
jgi:hypothetical protein